VALAAGREADSSSGFRDCRGSGPDTRSRAPRPQRILAEHEAVVLTVVPQPEALMTMASSPAPSISRSRRRWRRAPRRAPAFLPHVMGEGRRNSRRRRHHDLDAVAPSIGIVASLISGATTVWTQPVRSRDALPAHTLGLGRLLAGAESTGDGADSARGASASIPRSRAGSSGVSGLRQPGLQRGPGGTGPAWAGRPLSSRSRVDARARKVCSMWRLGVIDQVAYSARPDGQVSCRRGRRGSGRYASRLGRRRLAVLSMS